MIAASATYSYFPPAPGSLWTREEFLTILRTALSVRETRFARQVALAWLAAFPGDLPASLLYARALTGDGRPEQALPVLEELCQLDPEYLEANELRAQLLQAGSPVKAVESAGYVIALSGNETALQKGLFDQTVAAWSRLLAQARAFLGSGDIARAEQAIHQALAAHPANSLMAATHLKIIHTQAQAKNAPAEAIRSLAEFYHNQWPECLPFTLLLADTLMDGGEPEKAVALLHHAAARDVTGQVATRLWGEKHPYRSLWPDRIEAFIELPIPAGVAAVLGWNRLPPGSASAQRNTTPFPSTGQQADQAPYPDRETGITGLTKSMPGKEEAGETLQGELYLGSLPWEMDAVEQKGTAEDETIPIRPASPPADYSPDPEMLRSVQAELERVAERLNQPGLTRSDGRLPVYVIMTTRRGLQAAFGPGNAAALEDEMKRLAEAIQGWREWRAVLFYADEGVCIQGRTSKISVRPARHTDPWGLKLALADLDAVLNRKGEMIGAVLIVGGPEVVPFHHLPNPVDDMDEAVPSDNPYGTRDENYFIPEWPVGRLPDSAPTGSQDATPLMSALRALTGQHMAWARSRRPRLWIRRWSERLGDWMKGHMPGAVRIRPSFGYTAAIWRKASFSVFRPIGKPRAMLVSPPVQASPPLVDEADNPQAANNRQNGRGRRRMRASLVPAAKLAYFNLHGLEDAVEWYGQRDPGDGIPGETGDCTDYPVALRPDDVRNGGRAPQVVFSEACFGAHILGKSVDDALALKFLQSGSQAVVGSTCTAYGSVSTPLIAADFLGESFWNYLRKGLPAGEALRRSKIALAQEMHQRQGYLDGEDQKTLIAFVLYGDPLAQPLGKGPGAKSVLRPVKPPETIHTVCDRSRNGAGTGSLPPEVMAHVKSVVEKYLPGMADAHVTVSEEHAECHHAGHECPTAQLDSKAPLTRQPNRRLIILSKQVTGNAHLHRHYARLTLDSENRLVKMVVSR